MSRDRDNIRRTNLTEENEHSWYGFHRAKVIDAHDLKKLGRVKIWIPDIMPDIEYSCISGIWAHPANNPIGGRNLPDMDGTVCDFEQGHYQGSCMIPPEGSWVWIFFENGDPNWPYYFAAADTGYCFVFNRSSCRADRHRNRLLWCSGVLPSPGQACTSLCQAYLS